MTEWLLLLLSVSLMFACGVFVAAEYAFVTVDRATIERDAAAGDRSAAGTLKALRTLSTQLSGAQLGITITNLVIGFLAEPALGTLLRGPFEALGLSEGRVQGVRLRDRADRQHRRDDAGRRAHPQEHRARDPAGHGVASPSCHSASSPRRWPGRSAG